MVSHSCEVVKSINDINENQWNNFVCQSVGATAFHRVGWLRAIEEGLDLEPRHVVVRKKGNPIAICPNFISEIKTPFEFPIDFTGLGLAQLASVTPGFGGPLISSNRRRSFEAIFNTIEAIADRNIIVHRLRILDPHHVQYAQQLHARGYTPSLLYCRLWLELDDYERILNEMEKERRKEIRNANDNDLLSVEEEEITREAMSDFYSEYCKTIKRTEGTRYPLSFFESLADYFANRIEIFTAYRNGQSIGKHLYIRDEEQGSFQYLFAGIDERYFKYSSPTLLHDYAIRWSVKNGYRIYDFGGTSSNHSDGVFAYKRQFGAQTEPVYEWECGHAAIRWRLYRLARRQYLSAQ